MLPRRTFEDRFWQKVEKLGQDDCWLWSAAVDRHGYGRVGKGGKTTSAHRVSWELHTGSDASGKVIHHRCDNPRCVNPHHLSIGTQRDNLRDMRKKGRAAKPPINRLVGSKNGASKLTLTQIVEIRELAGVTPQRTVAKRYGISPGQVSRIQTGRRWPNVAS